MFDKKDKKIKMSNEDLLRLSSGMIKNIEGIVKNQDQKIAHIVETVKQLQPQAHQPQPEAPPQPFSPQAQFQANADYSFNLGIIVDMAQWDKMYGDDMGKKQKLDEFKNKIEVLMKEYKVQSCKAHFFKKF